MILDWIAARNGRFERKLLKTLVQVADVYGHLDSTGIFVPPLKAILDSQQTWGENCGPIQAGEQKGFCAFKTGQLLATHSFSMHVLVEAQNRASFIFPETQLITTQTDGRTRNGLSYALATHIKHHLLPWGPNVSMCMYRGGTVPHANLDKPSGWWNEHLYGQITHFLSGNGPVSEELTPDINAGECSALPLERGALRRDRDLGMLVVPQAAPKRATELWSGPLWLFLRAVDEFADLLKPSEGLNHAESGDAHRNDPNVSLVSGLL